MRRPDLHSDCASCAALCCVATCFEASAHFAFDKPAGVACPHLAPDCRCAIHATREAQGMGGCVAYDCYGAGPRATRAFAGLPEAERARQEAFHLLRDVHEQLWFLTEAAKLYPVERGELGRAIAEEVATLDALAAGPPSRLAEADLGARRQTMHALLRQVGAALGRVGVGQALQHRSG
jgi:hypothetical protein